MRTTRRIQMKIVLILSILFMAGSSMVAQSKTTPHTLDPLPELLLSNQGTLIESPEQWEEIRRNEILQLFRDHVYGSVPEAPLTISHEIIFMDKKALGGTAVMKVVEAHISNGVDMHSFSMLIFLPSDLSAPAPLFLGLNFNGNHTVLSDPRIRITENWVRNNNDLGIKENKALESSRGTSAKRWPLELILSRGYGLATIYAGDIDPDYDDGFKNGIHALFQNNNEERDPGEWGTIAAWAWGLSRALDYFETDPDVDEKRVAVIGHSRLGKTSLWAGAQDQRFAMVVSNNSGCGGAALSKRAFGETVSRINSSFPHWFADRFNDYNDNEGALPVDQHMLLALVAPRPLYVASAVEDQWADPYGEYLSLYYGSRVYGLYGKGMLKNDQLPEVDQPRLNGNLGYHIRTGKHDITRYDWEQYLDFADKHMGLNE